MNETFSPLEVIRFQTTATPSHNSQQHIQLQVQTAATSTSPHQFVASYIHSQDTQLHCASSSTVCVQDPTAASRAILAQLTNTNHNQMQRVSSPHERDQIRNSHSLASTPRLAQPLSNTSKQPKRLFPDQNSENVENSTEPRLPKRRKELIQDSKFFCV